MLCSGSKKGSWISHRNAFPLQGSLSNPKSFKKTPYLGLSGAPQWRCLTQAVAASHSGSFCCCFNVCKVEWERHRNSWLSFPGRAAQLHLGAQRAPRRETSNGDRGATGSAGTWHLRPDGERLESRKVFCAASSPPGAAPAITSPCLSAELSRGAGLVLTVPCPLSRRCRSNRQPGHRAWPS